MALGQRFRYVALAALVLLMSGVGRATPEAPKTRTPIPVYIFAGQSNMAGASASAAKLAASYPALAKPQRDVLFFGPDDESAFRWTHLRAKTEYAQSSYGPGFGPEVSAAAALAKDRPLIAVVKYARNGTNLYHDWDPHRPDGLYANMIERVRLAIDELELETHERARVAGFFWMQGEGDSYRYAHATAYGAHLTYLIDRMRADLGDRTLPVVLGHIADISGPYAWIVQDEQATVASTHFAVRMVETDDLAHDPNSLVHLSTKGEVDLGSRFARALGAVSR